MDGDVEPANGNKILFDSPRLDNKYIFTVNHYFLRLFCR